MFGFAFKWEFASIVKQTICSTSVKTGFGAREEIKSGLFPLATCGGAIAGFLEAIFLFHRSPVVTFFSAIQVWAVVSGLH